MVNIFGNSTGEDGPGNLQVVRKVIISSGKFIDYYNEIVASHRLGFPAYRYKVDIDASALLISFNSRAFHLTSQKRDLNDVSTETVTEEAHLAYWIVSCGF